MTTCRCQSYLTFSPSSPTIEQNKLECLSLDRFGASLMSVCKPRRLPMKVTLKCMLWPYSQANMKKLARDK